MSNNLRDWQHRQHKQDKALLTIIKLFAALVFLMVCALFYEIASTKPNVPPVPMEFQTPEQAFQRQKDKQKDGISKAETEEKQQTELETLREVEIQKDEEKGAFKEVEKLEPEQEQQGEYIAEP